MEHPTFASPLTVVPIMIQGAAETDHAASARWASGESGSVDANLGRTDLSAG